MHSAAGDVSLTLVVAGARVAAFIAVVSFLGPNDRLVLSAVWRGTGMFFRCARRHFGCGAGLGRIGVAGVGQIAATVGGGPSEHTGEIGILAEHCVLRKTGGRGPAGLRIAPGILGGDLQNRVDAIDGADVGVVGIGATGADRTVDAEVDRSLGQVSGVRESAVAATVVVFEAHVGRGKEIVERHGWTATCAAATDGLRRIGNRLAGSHLVRAFVVDAGYQGKADSLAGNAGSEHQVAVGKALDLRAEVAAIRRQCGRRLSKHDIGVYRRV